jgi:hypothetical protein
MIDRFFLLLRKDETPKGILECGLTPSGRGYSKEILGLNGKGEILHKVYDSSELENRLCLKFDKMKWDYEVIYDHGEYDDLYDFLYEYNNHYRKDKNLQLVKRRSCGYSLHI